MCGSMEPVTNSKREVHTGGHKLTALIGRYLLAPEAPMIKEEEMNGREVENECLECWTRAETIARVAASTACRQR